MSQIIVSLNLNYKFFNRKSVKEVDLCGSAHLEILLCISFSALTESTPFYMPIPSPTMQPHWQVQELKEQINMIKLAGGAPAPAPVASQTEEIARLEKEMQVCADNNQFTRAMELQNQARDACCFTCCAKTGS